jgi:WW domain-binding protein 4
MGLDPNATPPPVPSSSRTAATPAPKPSDPYSNYSTAASLGYVDEEGEKLAAETALRQTEGRAGNWVTVPVPVLHSTPSTAEPSLLEQAAPLEDPDDVRTWKFDGTDTKRRRIAVGMGNIYNPGKLNVIRKEHQKKEEDSENSVKAEEVLPLPKWTPKTWSRPGQGCGSSSSSALVQDSPGAGSDEGVPSAETGSMAAKTEDSKSLIGEQFGEASPPSAGIKTEEALDEPPPHTPTSSAMFRKRKRPGVSAGPRA